MKLIDISETIDNLEKQVRLQEMRVQDEKDMLVCYKEELIDFLADNTLEDARAITKSPKIEDF